jgi:hypothetical protein
VRCLYTIVFLLIASMASGATYHIDPTAGNGGDGSHGSPYNEWSDLPSMSTSDDVYFKCDTTYTATGQISITWGGASGDRAVIGAYYLDGGSPVYGVSGNKPVISGSNYTIPYSTSATAWGGLIRIDGRTVKKDYITIQNIEVLKAGGYGIEILGDKTVATTPQYCIIENCYTNGSSRIGIAVVDTESVNATIRNNEVLGYAYGWKYLGFGPTWSGGLVFAHCKTADSEVYGNYVHQGWGEGIGSFTFSTAGQGGIKIYNNIVYSSRRVDIYMDGSSNNEVYNNVLIGTDDCVYKGVTILRDDGGCWNQVGIALNAESYDRKHPDYTPENPVYWVMDVTDNEVYNNLIVGHLTGLEIGVGNQVHSDNQHKNNKIFNNTFISNRYNMRADSGLADLTTSGNELKNNIFACIDYAAPDGCVNQGGMVANFDNYYDTDYNMWKAPLPTNGAGNNDLEARIDGWELTSLPLHDLQEGNIQDVVSFAKKLLGNAGVGSGVADADAPTTDYFGATRDDPPDRGFDEYGGATVNFPPTISAYSPASQCVATSTNLTLAVDATDPDGDTLYYSWLEEGVEISTQEDPGNRQWASEGFYDLRVNVSDGKGGSAFRVSTIEVSDSCGGGATPTTSTVGLNAGDDAQNTVDCYIRAQTADQDTAYNNSKLEIEDPFNDDAGQKLALIQFDTTAFTGITATKAELCVTIQQAPDQTTDVEVYAADNDFTESATWNNYDGSNAWTEEDSPETQATLLEDHTVTDSTTGEICFDSTDTAALLTYVNAEMGGVTSFVLGADTETDTDIELVSSEGADGSRPYLRLTYNIGGSTDLLKCEWATADGTLGQSDTLSAVCTWDGAMTLGNTDTLTIDTSVSGAVLGLVATGDGTANNQYIFIGTVPASATTGTSELELVDGVGDDIVLSGGGSFDGDLELPDFPYRPQDTGSIYIDTLTDTITATCMVASGGTTCISADHVYKFGDRPRFRAGWPTAMTISGGSSAEVSLTVSLDAGSDLVFNLVEDTLGTPGWIFEAQPIETDMRETDIRMANVGDLAIGGVTIEDLAGNDASSTDFPDVDLDTTYKCAVDGTPRSYRYGGGTVQRQAVQY